MTEQTRLDAEQIITEVVWKRAFDRDGRTIGRAQSIAQEAVLALRREGLIKGSDLPPSGQTLEEWADTFHDGPPIRGISHLIAEALVLLNLPAVHRDTLKALMPSGDSQATASKISFQFRVALRKLHSRKWIERSGDDLVRVLDRDALVRWFTVARDETADRAATVLDLARAVAQTSQTLRTGEPDELRRRELLALQHLMQTAPGSVTNERGLVRVVSKSNPL